MLSNLYLTATCDEVIVIIIIIKHLFFISHYFKLCGYPYWLSGKESTCNVETSFWSLGQEYPLEKEMATQFSILAWRIPWTEEPGGLQTMGLQKSRTQLSN